MKRAVNWLARPEDWDLLGLREKRELAPAVVELAESSGDPVTLRRAASFLREAGWGDDGLEAARAALATDASWESAIVLAGAHRGLDQLEDALHYYAQARELRPEDPSPWLDVGDMLAFEWARAAEGLAAYAQVLDRDSRHPWALPSWLYLLAQSGDEVAGEKLLELAGDQPDNGQAFRLAMAWRLRERLYWGCLPPSPEEEGPALLAPLLRLPYHAQFWGAAAVRVGRRVAEDDLDSLLQQVESEAPFRVRLGAALVLSRLDDEWEGSPRRDILLSLLDAGHAPAVVAAGLLAFEEAEPRTELVERLWSMVEERPALHEVLQPVMTWHSPGFPN